MNIKPGQLYLGINVPEIWIVLDVVKDVSGWLNIKIFAVPPSKIIQGIVTSEAEPISLFEQRYCVKQLLS